MAIPERKHLDRERIGLFVPDRLGRQLPTLPFTARQLEIHAVTSHVGSHHCVESLLAVAVGCHVLPNDRARCNCLSCNSTTGKNPVKQQCAECECRDGVQSEVSNEQRYIRNRSPNRWCHCHGTHSNTAEVTKGPTQRARTSWVATWSAKVRPAPPRPAGEQPALRSGFALSWRKHSGIARQSPASQRPRS